MASLNTARTERFDHVLAQGTRRWPTFPAVGFLCEHMQGMQLLKLVCVSRGLSAYPGIVDASSEIDHPHLYQNMVRRKIMWMI
jgi:hypothetical protein